MKPVTKRPAQICSELFSILMKDDKNDVDQWIATIAQLGITDGKQKQSYFRCSAAYICANLIL